MNTMTTIDMLRTNLDSLDAQLIDLLGRRFAVCEQVASYKQANGIPMMQRGRIDKVKQQATSRGSSLGLTSDFVSRLYDLIIEEACRREIQLMDEVRSSEPKGHGEATIHASPTEGYNPFDDRGCMLSETAELSPAVVIGARGSVGQLFVRKLHEHGIAVTGLDRTESTQAERLPGYHIRTDIHAPNAEAVEAIMAAKLVIVCLPEATALAARPIIGRHMSVGALWADTLSIKSRICADLAANMKQVEVLSLNPMFAPAIGFDGQNIVAVQVYPGAKSARLLELLQTWNATVVSMSAPDHDLLSSAVQAATHAAVLSFGLSLHELDIDMARAWSISTPPFRVLAALLSRIVLSNPEVYWEIQTANPFASYARSDLTTSLSEIESSVRQRDFGRFCKVFRIVREVIGANAGELTAICSRLFSQTDPKLSEINPIEQFQS
jgi:4-amino-4-deoxyprephenate dehydrogenase